MALKGKKKSRVRGSQARRRPASAPRPSYGSREKPPWYQTTQGMVVGFLVIVSLIIFVWAWVADSRSDSEARAAQREALQSYTTDLRAFIQELDPIASVITASASLSDKELEKEVDAWKDELSGISVISEMSPPEELSAMTGLVDVVMGLYGQSIEQFELVPTLEGKIREEVSAKATASYLTANNVLVGIIGSVDAARASADLGPSGLTPPAAPQVQTSPSPGG